MLDSWSGILDGRVTFSGKVFYPAKEQILLGRGLVSSLPWYDDQLVTATHGKQ